MGLGLSFHTGQIYAARYPIMPLLTSKMVNFYAYFRHLGPMYNWKEAPSHAAVTFYQRLLSFLLATVVCVMQQKSQSASRDSAGPSDASDPIDISSLQYMVLEIFAKFLRTFWSTAPLRGVPDQKFFHQKFCLTMGNMFHTIWRG